MPLISATQGTCASGIHAPLKTRIVVCFLERFWKERFVMKLKYDLLKGGECNKKRTLIESGRRVDGGTWGPQCLNGPS